MSTDSHQSFVCHSYLMRIHSLLTSSKRIKFVKDDTLDDLMYQLKNSLQYCTEKQLKYSHNQIFRTYENNTDISDVADLNIRVLIDAFKMRPYATYVNFIRQRADNINYMIFKK